MRVAAIKKGKSVVLASDAIPGSSKIPMTEASSPAEVAKAYMGSRPNKDFSLSGSFRDQAFNEERKSNSMGSDRRCLNLSVAPRSVIRLPAVPEQQQCQNHAYQTTKLVGRSAMYRMSRSPYFKVNRAASTQIGEISRDDHSSPVSSQWKSHGKQSSDGTEKSIMLPLQSSEKAHKLLQQLDKLSLSSRKEKPSELKAMTIDESTSKLTLDMLHGRALKSTEDTRSSNLLSTHKVGKAAIATSLSIPISKAPAFRICAPEDSFDLDDDEDDNTNHLSVPLTSTLGSTTKVSAISTLSNGSLNPSPNNDPLPSNSIMGNNTPTNSVLNISSVPSAAAMFSATAPTPLFQQSDTEAKSFNSSTFSPVLPTSTPSMTTTTASTSPAISPAFSSTASTVFGFGASTQSIGSTIFGASNGSTTTSTTFASSYQNSKPAIFGATDNNSSQNSATPVTFGTITFGAGNNNNISSQDSSMTPFGASTTTTIQKPDSITFGFGATNNNPQKPSAITFGTQSTQSSTCQFGSFSFSPWFGLRNNSAFGSFTSSSPNPFTSIIFGSSSQASSSSSSSAPVFGSSASGSSAPGSGSGFMFGSSAPGSTSTPAPFTFNLSSTSTPLFGAQKPTFGFGANSPSNDQMSVEDSMADAANQAPRLTFPAFGQPQNPTAAVPGFILGSPAPTLSFGGVQNPPVQPQPFQPGGLMDFNLDGSFSLGSGGGGDKPTRKIIKVKMGLPGRR